ncbi:hemerythrin domain-containing protein [Acrocarpospora catenulata]|uniref:hemerythrin domain-containing protein n=1 Tax=Acrocarpospora catenulata TaxID=2836182 RepID=UPI001BDA584C|nr:hemerythrin domain-containing protein [Acrocarpospora catenulata]
MTVATDERPYVQEMVIIHRMFRRESRVLPDAVRRVAAGDAARAGIVAAHYRQYAHSLHHHHTNEDELLWPKLLARVDLEAELVLRMEAQHEVVAGTLNRVSELLPEWERTADPVVRDEIVAELGRHRDALIEHLDEEEQHILPLVSEHLTVPEWQALGERAQAELAKESPERQLLTLGAILEEITPEERERFLADLPLPAKVMWRLIGRRRYARRMSLIRGN